MTKSWALMFAGLTLLLLASATSPTCAEDKPPAPGPRASKDASLVVNDAAGFAEAGQLTISTDAALSVERKTQSQISATTSLSIFPAADYFVVKNLSLGGAVGVGYQKTGSSHATSVRLGPRLGSNFELTRILSFWPKLGLSYTYTRSELKRSSASDAATLTTNHGIAINVFAPVMLILATHFFVGFGPFLDTDLSGKNRSTTWGFRLTMGGWLDLRARPSAPSGARAKT